MVRADIDGVDLRSTGVGAAVACGGEPLPQCMQDLLDRNVKGIRDGKGFYRYNSGDFKRWMEMLTKATHNMQMSARGYLREVVRIENESFSSPWSEGSLREELCGRLGSFFFVAELEGQRGHLVAGVDESARARYERLFKFKGENVVVGVQHGVCGGCHMRLPPQLLVHCQAEQEIVTCPNCGRILYYTRDMDLAVAE